jgi:hypothetical protein
LIKTPAVYVVDSEFAGASLKHNAQFKKKRHRGPCVVQVEPAKELTRLLMLGAIVLGRCKAGDRYWARKKTCRTKDKKRYPVDMKLASSLADSQNLVKSRRMKRRDKRACTITQERSRKKDRPHKVNLVRPIL